eukprot:CAMPEP_0202703414 /NCGR_PEP_ID=MMETSP1385-20130828/16271_1 /ASSEMBLY_ACC=CAM_ASM_000861 /TAXON_ID=933848 /ORGANISM="Elphidium margaritaceum" /LENGTH=73 /DNA_ID=CAMNT_0049361267 /DNA_START=28 /DNA_END=246 /DNA_ORIENTATION=-
MEETVHKISLKAFESMRRAHDFLFQTLNAMVPKSAAFTLCNELENMRHYLVVPLVRCEDACEETKQQGQQQDE